MVTQKKLTQLATIALLADIVKLSVYPKHIIHNGRKSKVFIDRKILKNPKYRQLYNINNTMLKIYINHLLETNFNTNEIKKLRKRFKDNCIESGKQYRRAKKYGEKPSWYENDIKLKFTDPFIDFDDTESQLKNIFHTIKSPSFDYTINIGFLKQLNK